MNAWAPLVRANGLARSRLAGRRTAPAWTAYVVALLFVFAPGTVAAQVVSRGTNGTVSVAASGVSVNELLEKLTDVHPFEKLIVTPAVGAQIVTVAIDNVTAIEAIKEVLAAAGADYVLSANRLVVGHSDFSGTRAPLKGVSSERLLEPLDELRDQPADRVPDDVISSDGEEERRQSELMHALTPPIIQSMPGAPIELPFPAADGRTPLTAVRGRRTPQAMPFPIPDAPRPAPAAPPPADPQLLELMKALSPKSGPGSR